MVLLPSSSLFNVLSSLLCAAALAEAAAGSHQLRSRQHARRPAEKRGDNHGMATFYNAETGNMGACGWFIGNSDWSVAIKGSMYGDYGRKSSWCGKTISITANGKTARNVVIADACPGCPEGASLDMTPGLFKFFSNPDAGVIPISWHLSSEDGNSDNDFKPLAPAKDLWKPSASSSKPIEPKPSPSKAPASKDWLPLSSWNPLGDEKNFAQATSSSTENTWTASSTYSAMNATRTTSVNSTDFTSSTSSNSTAIASMIRGNNTVALLPSNGVGPALTGGVSSSKADGSGGNLHRAAQIVLDLAGLTYAAATN